MMDDWTCDGGCCGPARAAPLRHTQSLVPMCAGKFHVGAGVQGKGIADRLPKKKGGVDVIGVFFLIFCIFPPRLFPGDLTFLTANLPWYIKISQTKKLPPRPPRSGLMAPNGPQWMI